MPAAMPEDTLTIGEVIDLLREEFPDVTVSKVRFLESQGLLAPDRSESGYRLFGRRDIERLRFILRQQRDHFLPLKVIKSKLTLWERGEEVDEQGPAPRADLLTEEGEPVTREELLRRSGLESRQLDELVEHGLISAIDHGEVFPAEAITIAAEARRLYHQGLGARHLRAIRHAAEREADVLFQLTAPLLRIRNQEARRQARAVLVESGEAMLAIHRTILAAELRRLLEP